MRSSWNVAAATILLAVLTPPAAQSDVVISNDPTQNMICQSNVCSPTQKDAVLNAGDLMNLLGSGNVKISTAFRHGKHPRNAGAVLINAPLNWATSNTLDIDTVEYYLVTQINSSLTIMGSGGLTVEKNGTINSSITVMGPGALIFKGYANLSFNGQINFWDLGGQLYINSTPYTLVGDVPTLITDIAAAAGKGLFALANDYDAKDDSFRKAPIPDFRGTFTGLGHTVSNLTIKKGHGECEGLFSINEGTIANIRLRNVAVTSATQRYVGAVAGCNGSSAGGGNINNVAVEGTVNGGADADVGGIAGINTHVGNSSIEQASASVSVSGGQAGGVVGENDGSIDQAYASGSVVGQSNAGGLVGANKNSISSTYTMASVNGNSGATGGLAGFNSANIVDSYSTGAVTGTGYLGGLVGYNPNESVSNSYWDLDTSGIGDPNQGSGFPKNDPSPVGLTTAQLQKRLPFGFRRFFWQQDANINNGFPYLRNVPPQ